MLKMTGLALTTRFPAVPRWAVEIVTAAVLTLLAIGARIVIERYVADVTPFPLVFPAIVVATILAGARAGLLVIVASQLFGWFFLLPVTNSFVFETRGDVVSLILATAAQLLLLWVMAGYADTAQRAMLLSEQQALGLAQKDALLEEQAALNRQLIEQQAELQAARQNIDAIYQASGDGLALCEAQFDEKGRVCEYQVIDVNRAHAELTSATREQMLTMPISTIYPPIDQLWFDTADRVLKTGLMHDFDIRSRANGKWLNIRVSRVSETRFQQTFIDISDRHRLEEQRRTLLKEMSHRVMNNFQMIAGFLHMQSAAADPGARDQLKTAERRVQVLAGLHSLLAYTESETDIDVSAFIKELCSYLGSSFERPEAVVVVCTADPLRLPTETVVPLGFVIAELVTNSAKYAYPAPAKGTIHIAFTVDADGWTLTVRDAGCGFGTAAPKSSGGLGTRLVARFVQQIGAELTTVSGPGVHHTVRFPASAQG